MNERIAKFANQSGFDVDATGKFGNYSEIHRLEKFAELIVKECLEQITEFKTEYHVQDHALAKIQSIIIKHFGIEE